MGYYNEKQLNQFMKEAKDVISCAMKEQCNNISSINRWTFNSDGNVVLIKTDQCGCGRDVGIIHTMLENIDVITDEEYMMQVEDILLEVDDLLGNDNLLMYVTDKGDVIRSCNECRNN